ncbi:hypothetical protein TNCV_650201 [Trichonephila clavipes]|nr:hypothetical protein TNCV_650201 [Trichonephila clavipes]
MSFKQPPITSLMCSVGETSERILSTENHPYILHSMFADAVRVWQDAILLIKKIPHTFLKALLIIHISLDYDSTLHTNQKRPVIVHDSISNHIAAYKSCGVFH